jgi:hypothetical protein
VSSTFQDCDLLCDESGTATLEARAGLPAGLFLVGFSIWWLLTRRAWRALTFRFSRGCLVNSSSERAAETPGKLDDPATESVLLELLDYPSLDAQEAAGPRFFMTHDGTLYTIALLHASGAFRLWYQ